MSNINFFDDSGRAPQPKEDVKIEELDVLPYPDRFRVFIRIQVTPFQERPNLILTARDDDDNIVSELNIIETMHADMEFTMHLRDIVDPTGVYTMQADLFYDNKNPPQDRRIEAFEIPEASEHDEAE